MSVLLLLIAVSLAMASLFVFLCLASLRSGQFDDMESPRWKVLFDGASGQFTTADSILSKAISIKGKNDDPH
jgi:cbb3-type cytochrome oxidase maturation protein